MADSRLADLEKAGVRTVRMTYPDLHGISRGKDYPIEHFRHLAEDGGGFCEAIMTVDLRHTVTAGFEHGFQDIVGTPDLDTLVPIPWEPGTSWCIADLTRMDGKPYEVDPRGAVRRAIAEFAELGLHPVIGPELEFYLCEPDPTAPNGYRRYVDNDSHVYTVGQVADPRRVLSMMLDACVDMGLGAIAANHEYGRSQFEINIGHAPALEAADHAFRLKSVVKDLAAREGLLATFIGKPWNDDEGSGFHLHLSLCDDDGKTLMNDEGGPEGISEVAHHLIAGLLEHSPALMAFFNPTTNAYRRIHPEALVPTLVSWGHDNRLTLARVPRERGNATRVEFRVGDGAANPYLVVAGALFAGLDGIRRKLEPPAPIEGLIYEHPDVEAMTPLPNTFEAALAALEADEYLTNAMGTELVRVFRVNKDAELARARSWATDWEFREYTHHL
jgi:glutamine synthetase